LAENGLALVEIPLFYHPSGGDHWKRIEHIWYITDDQFKEIAKTIGFEIDGSFHFDPTKITFILKKPKQKRTSFLLPPGVGDVYWPLTKLPAFLEREGISAPVNVYVAAPRAKTFNSHARAYPFLKMFPFIKCTEEVCFNHRDPVWKEAYLEQKRSIFKDVLGCDYFLSWNGHQRSGKKLEDVDPDLVPNWNLPRFISLKEDQYKEDAVKKYGRYVVFYWVFAGTNGQILKRFNHSELAEMMTRICKETNSTPVIVGAKLTLSNYLD
jgi:hypothetical protein